MNIPVREDYGDALLDELSTMEAQEEESHNERKDELDWIVEQLCNMSDENFREFIRAVKYQRKAESHRRRLSPNV